MNQRNWLDDHVGRVAFSHIFELIVDFDRAHKLELAFCPVLVFGIFSNNIKQALNVALVDDLNLVFFSPHHSREHDLDGPLTLCMVPFLHVDQILGDAHVLFLSFSHPNQKLLFPEVEVKLEPEIR